MEILHETCQEYFRRRLSEGWKCISLEGHNAILLSPDGIRRELDLRNDVETLRPNAAGDETSIPSQYPSSGEHWDKVDEPIPDDQTTHVYSTTADVYLRDLYNLPASSGSGTINLIKIYFRCHSVSEGHKAKPSLKSNSTVTDGTEIVVPIAWTTFSEQWYLNPATGQPWGSDWSVIDGLQIGVSLKKVTGVGHSPLCTQIYVEVDYTYAPPMPPITPEYQKREIARYGSEAEATLAELISRFTEFAMDSGTATGGSNTTLVDIGKSWGTDIWKGAVIEVHCVADGLSHYALISGNTATTITFAALAGAVSVTWGDDYALRLQVGIADIYKWGGTVLTGRDISLDLANLTKLIPLAKAAIFNTALPAAEANWLGSDIEPTNSPSYLRIYVCVSVTGILRVARTIGVTVTEDLNSGTALIVDAAYMFTVPWRTGDSINIKYSVTTGTIKRLLIDEIGGAE